MERILLLIFILVIDLNVYSQNNQTNRERETEETIEWINSKFVEHQFENSVAKQIQSFTGVKEINGIYYLMGEHTQDTEKGWGFSRAFLIPIKKINNISFVNKPNNVWLEIRMKNNEKAILETRDGEKWTELDSFAFMLANSIDDDNSRSRFTKAFHHLMELYGNVKVEKF